MKPAEQQEDKSITNRLAVLRIAFGLVWAIDAGFKFEPAFYRGILTKIESADSGEPRWLNPWFHTWYHIIGSNPQFFAIIIIAVETFLALALIFGVARRATYIGGAVFSLLVWAIGEGFGGPYVSGSTDIGAGIIYVFVFLMLYATDISKVPAYSAQPWLKKLYTRYSPHPFITRNKAGQYMNTKLDQ
jgi:thiosulfate dehydrogenase [quinone] large subunit